jgi:hypothetical protein
MSLYDKASLVQIPSGTKDGTLYSVLPANGNGDFTHVRASSATRVNKDGLIESVASGVPRLDYPLIDGVVQSCPALLLEPSRTNALPYSQDFSQWTPTSGITVTGSQFNELTGNSDAYKIETNGSTGFLQISETVAATSGNNTYSVFAKKGTNNKVSLRGLSGVDFRVVFDLDTGTIDSQLNTVSSKIEDYGSGWYRLSVVFSGANTTFYIYPNVLGTADAGNIYVYGAQLEVGTYETSYIPTSGSAVTRSADVCNGAGTSAEFNDTESSWFVELQGLAEDNTNKYISISDGGGSPYTNSLSIQYRNNGTLRIFHNGLDFADAIFVGGSSFDLTENHKIAIRFKENDMAVYIDGVSQSLSGSFVYQSISGLNTLRIEQPNAGNAFYGKVKQLMVFNEALTDAELATLTS